jgi:hypothetical protein
VLEALKALDRRTLEAKLGRCLTGPQIEGILKRRDRIVALAARRVQQQGEAAVLYLGQRREFMATRTGAGALGRETLATRSPGPSGIPLRAVARIARVLTPLGASPSFSGE